jgi:GTPase
VPAYLVYETTLDELEFILSIVLNQVDMCPPNVLQDTLRLLLKLLKSPGCRKTPVLVRTKDDVVLSATNFVSER